MSSTPLPGTGRVLHADRERHGQWGRAVHKPQRPPRGTDSQAGPVIRWHIGGPTHGWVTLSRHDAPQSRFQESSLRGSCPGRAVLLPRPYFQVT